MSSGEQLACQSEGRTEEEHVEKSRASIPKGRLLERLAIADHEEELEDELDACTHTAPGRAQAHPHRAFPEKHPPAALFEPQVARVFAQPSDAYPAKHVHRVWHGGIGGMKRATRGFGNALTCGD